MMARDLARAFDPALIAHDCGIEPDAWQAKLLRERPRRSLLLCARQTGKTTTTALGALDCAIYQPGSLTLILSPSQRQSAEMHRTIMGFHARLEGAPALNSESVLKSEFANGSRIIALPGTEKTIRGYAAADLCIIDEAARVEDELLAAVRPMLATSNGRLIALSTPAGKRGWFFESWTTGDDWTRIKVAASECPRISQAFLDEELRVGAANAQFICGGSATGGEPQNGGLSFATPSTATACGGFSSANGDSSSAFGALSSANGGVSSAFGSLSSATGDRSSAFGVFSTATGNNATAIGYSTSANFVNSTAIGNGATATRVNQQVFGTATNTYTMPGITSAASKAAQSGPLQLVTSDTGGNLATSTLANLGLASSTDISAINSNLGAINSNLGAINSRLDDLTSRSNRAYTGIAMAFAMAGVPTVLPNERFAIAGNWGTFEGANGLALNAAARITDNVQFNAGIGYGPDERIVGGRAGLRFGW